MEFGKRIGKVTCLVGNCDGFIANRLMNVSGLVDMLQNGVMPHEIDTAAEAYGMRMGPCRMYDVVGLDLFAREKETAGTLKPDKMVFDALYAAKRLGQKNGKGFYMYNEKLAMSRDPDAETIIENLWKNAGVTPKNLSQEEIVERLYLPLVNEGFKCLEEGMAIRPSDIDVCMLFGYSWPRYRGGPMQWASAIGLPKVLEKLESIGVKPADLLKESVQKKWRLNSKELLERAAAAWSKGGSKL